jgi:hypothetical protein
MNKAQQWRSHWRQGHLGSSIQSMLRLHNEDKLGKQLQDLHTDAALLLETHLNPDERFSIPNFHFYHTDHFPQRKGIPHNHEDLCYMCDTYTWQRWSLFIRDKPILLLGNMLHKDCDCKSSVAKKNLVIASSLGTKTNCQLLCDSDSETSQSVGGWQSSVTLSPATT